MTQDLAGCVFGKLTVISFYIEKYTKRKKKYFWNCLCECGNNCIARADMLKGGNKLSCGCLRLERLREVILKYGEGVRKTPEYCAWNNIKQRCSNPNRKCAEHYVEKGIKVCSRWLKSFDNFLSDMGMRPSSKHTIERRKNHIGYTKENCYWATREVQSRNQTNNVWLEYKGNRMVLSDWAKELGVTPCTLKNRVNRNMPIESIFQQGNLRNSLNSSNTVLQLDIETNKIINEYASSAKAALALGFPIKNHIGTCCLGKKNSYAGFKWRYKNRVV